VAGLCAAVLLLSEDLRWRVRQFVNRYLYRHKYDYRDQWVTFTRRVGAPTSLSELSDRLLETVSGTVGATRGAIYLHDDLEVNVYRRAGVLGPDPWPATLSASVGTLAQMMIPPWRPRVLQHPGERSASLVDQPELASVQPPALVIPLGWHAEPVGLILLGPQRTGLPYDAEDVELLATLAQQATGALVSLRLAEAAARAREFAAFHRFTSYVLHDLKSTVSALSLLSRNAERHLHDPEFQRDALQTLARSVDRMRALLARLAPTASLNAPPARVPVDLRAVVGQLADTVPTSDHLHLVRALDPVPPVLGDPEALQQALRSIIDNALEAMEHKGTLTLGTSWRAPWVHVSVSDTGCGMTPEFIHSSLFVPFRTTKPGGWGVGLYYAREIVAAHGGRIEVVSAQGKGTAVSLILPLAPAGGDSSSS
jgi:putative PEP-CTERM system histidine kinase